jgi:hypothetical protein
MWNKALFGISLLASSLAAQDGLKVNFPADAPVSVVSSGWGESRAIARGGAYVVDVRTSLKLKNNSRLRVRGISLQVSSQEVAAGGKASVSVPSLDVYPGQEFPVKIDLRLLQPNGGSGVAVVQVQLDGILFEDLSFFGPNRLGSRRQLTAWETEARRDRQHLRMILSRSGEDALRRTMLDVLARDNSRPKLDVRLARSSATLANSRNIETAFLSQPDLPVEGIKAVAVSSGNQLQILELAFQNRDKREVRSIELGLLVRDQEGREFSAGSLPALVSMKPKGGASVQPSANVTLNRPMGLPMKVESLTGFVQQVEFANGDVWVPPSAFRDEARLAKLIPGSLEEQRLSDIYRRRGMPALLEELNRQ